MGVSLLNWLRPYLAEGDLNTMKSVEELASARLKCREIFDYMDLEWDSDYDRLRLTDVLDRVMDEIAELVDHGVRHPRATKNQS